MWTNTWKRFFKLNEIGTSSDSPAGNASHETFRQTFHVHLEETNNSTDRCNHCHPVYENTKKLRYWTCIAPIVSITRPLSAQMWITQSYLQIHHICLSFVCYTHSPEGALLLTVSPIYRPIYYSFPVPLRVGGWVGLVGWPISGKVR